MQSTNAAQGGAAYYNVSVNQAKSDFYENLFVGYDAELVATQQPNGTNVVLNWAASPADAKRKVTYFVILDGGKETKVTKTTCTFNKVGEGDHVFSVYAKDEYGYSEPVQSNWVIVEGESWSVELQVYKTFRKAGLTTVSGSDQSIVIGMDSNATFGFDPSLDIAAATRTVPGTDTPDPSPLPLGAAYSIGMDNTCTKLTQDIRPFGRSSVWYIRVDMGDPSINGFELSWADATLPTTSVGALKLTRMIQLTDKTWEPISDTTVDMMDVTSVSLDESDLDTLQQDEYGQYYAVYRVTMGGADEAQTITLKPGWNMISFAVTPLLNNVDDVFTVNSTKLIRGNAWRYEGGQYVAAATIDAGVGYWIYGTPIPKSFEPTHTKTLLASEPWSPGPH